MKKCLCSLMICLFAVSISACEPFAFGKVRKVKDVQDNAQRVIESAEDKTNDISKKAKNIEKNKKSTKTYTTGITNIDDALRYETGLYFFEGEASDAGMNPDVRVITANTKSVKASELPEKMLTETVYNYLNNYKDELRFDRGYTEDEVKAVLEELYGENYIYDHKLTQTSACASLAYSNETGNYEMVGGCGGLIADYEPRIRMKVLEKTDTTVTIGRLYYVPTEGSDGFSASAPYKVYNNENKDKLIATLNNEDSNIFDTYKNDIDKYLITFDKDNGFYHFNNLKKIN